MIVMMMLMMEIALKTDSRNEHDQMDNEYLALSQSKDVTYVLPSTIMRYFEDASHMNMLLNKDDKVITVVV